MASTLVSRHGLNPTSMMCFHMDAAIRLQILIYEHIISHQLDCGHFGVPTMPASSASSANLHFRQSSIRNFFSENPTDISPQPPPSTATATTENSKTHGATALSEEPLAVLTSNGKRKQPDSNLQSLKKNHSDRAPPKAIAEPPITDYEREREENIRRNRECLQTLGIISAVERLHKPKPKPPPPPPPRLRVKSPPPQAIPLRRSTRKRVLTERIISQLQDRTPAETFLPIEHDDSSVLKETFVPIEYDDSSVLKYMCSIPPADAGSGSASDPASRLVGFRRVGAKLADPSLVRIYSADVAFLDGSERALLAAGGHGGRISVYGTSIASADVDDVAGETEEPLMTWSGSRTWISGVRFVKMDSMLLLSSSNDGGLVLWDFTKTSSERKGVKRSASPPIVAEARDLHSKGIFAMHGFDGLIATASKDSSVGISRLGSSSIEADRTISGHHSGPVRGVCFRDSDILGDCGADNRICILDLRLLNSCTLTIESDHRTGVNVVEWSPSQDFLLLSASRDPELLLYDIRSSGQPLHKLQGHTDSNLRKRLQIYRPAFVGNGKAVATPGQGSRKISLYDAHTGKAISRGFVGYDANLVMCNANDKASSQRMWMAGKQITQLSPIFQVSADASKGD